MLRQMLTSAILASSLLWSAHLNAQTATRPLTNDDVAAMAQGGLDENTIVSAIRAQSSSFDISASSLLKLKKNGVTPNVMGAMFAAVTAKRTPSPPQTVALATAPQDAKVPDSAAQTPDAQPNRKRSWLKAKNALWSRASGMALGLASGRQSESDPVVAFSSVSQATEADAQAQSPAQNLYWTSPNGEVMSASPATQTSSQPATAPGAALKGTIVMFVPWRDPREGAFILNVPQGWQVSGGTTRNSAIDPRQSLRATSPDGHTQLFIGDPNLIPREVPNRLLAYAGVREGQTTQGPWGGPILIARYQSGEQFARSYVSHLCPVGQILSSNVVPEATRQLTAKAQDYGRAQGAQAQAWVGEATFRCGAQSGYVRASTVLAGSPAGAQVWAVLELSGFTVADPSQATSARYVLNNIVGSMQMNPQWEARQAQATKDVTGAVTRAQQQMAASIAQHAREQASHDQIDVMSGWEKRNKSLDATMQRDAEVRRGTVTANDSYTGTSHTVSNDYNHYWTRADGSIMGTMTDTPPDYSSGWRMMTTH